MLSVMASGLDQGILPELLGYQLRRAQLLLFQHFACALQAENVTPGQVGLLVLVSRNPGMSQAALAKSLGVERSTLGEAVNRLAKRGLVVRETAPRDRRSKALRLSAAGQTFLADLLPRVHRHEDAVAAHLSPQERRTLVELLDRLVSGTGKL